MWLAMLVRGRATTVVPNAGVGVPTWSTTFILRYISREEKDLAGANF